MTHIGFIVRDLNEKFKIWSIDVMTIDLVSTKLYHQAYLT